MPAPVVIDDGSQVFGHLVSLRVPVEDFLPQVFGVASIALAIPAVVPSFTLRLLSFFVFEVCCGLYWPGMGTLRGRYIPDDIRSTVMNLFRLPLNFIVVVTLLYVSAVGSAHATQPSDVRLCTRSWSGWTRGPSG